jgi:hypothetical protein
MYLDGVGIKSNSYLLIHTLVFLVEEGFGVATTRLQGAWSINIAYV